MRKKCLQCNGKLYRSYIRENNIDKKRKWKTIGYYCISCQVNFTEKELSNKTRKNTTKK